MRQERLYRTEAIVLRQRDYGEADRILTLLTPKGKLSALAPGVRRPTSRKAGHLGLFCRTQLLLARGRNMDIVTQAESIEEFEGIRGDLLRYGYACYAGELVERFAQEEDDNGALLNLLTFGLRWFAEEQDLLLGMCYFQLCLLSYSGYQPQLFSCVVCRSKIQPTTNFFSADLCGLLCGGCGPRDAQTKAVSVNAQKVLRYLQTHDASDVRALRISRGTKREIESLLHHYLEYVLERELKSVVFLRRLRKELRAAEGSSND